MYNAPTPNVNNFAHSGALGSFSLVTHHAPADLLMHGSTSQVNIDILAMLG